MVLSDSLHHADLYEALLAGEQELGRPVNPTLLTPAQWRGKRAQTDSFAARIASAAHLYVIGSEHDLA